MTVDKNIVDEIAQIEAVQLTKVLFAKYPSKKEDSGPIILTTLENSVTLVLSGLEKGVKPKDVMRQFSKNVLVKVKALKENIEEYKKANADSKT